MPAGPGHRLLAELAERQHDAAATLVDDVEATCQPDQQDQRDQQADAAHRNAGGRALRWLLLVALAAALAPEQRVQSLSEVVPDFVEVRGTAVTAATAAAAWFAAPLRIVQGHGTGQIRGLDGCWTAVCRR